MRLEYVNKLTITYIANGRSAGAIYIYDGCSYYTLVMVRLDYMYVNVLLCGGRDSVIRQLERVQRQASRVIY